MGRADVSRFTGDSCDGGLERVEKESLFFSFSSPTADVHIERENGDGPRILLSK